MLYEGLYRGIDLHLRQQDGHLEYDLLCAPGADLLEAVVEVEGADGLRVDEDGSLVIETALGPIRQPKPSTWEDLGDGNRRAIDCEYVLLGGDCFGFMAEGWDGAHALVLDPGLLWSTIPSIGDDYAVALAVDANGVVTLTGSTDSTDYPTTNDAYDKTLGGSEVFITRLDPSKSGSAQLLYSTFLGGDGNDYANALVVDATGVMTVLGRTNSTNYPTTSGAYDTTHNGGADVFVTRLDPSENGAGQLLYSTSPGGKSSENESLGLSVDANGVVTLGGATYSVDFPTTLGAYDRTGNSPGYDGFVSRLDPSKAGAAQLVYSTYFGASNAVTDLFVDASGVITVGGWTSPNLRRPPVLTTQPSTDKAMALSVGWIPARPGLRNWSTPRFWRRFL